VTPRSIVIISPTLQNQMKEVTATPRAATTSLATAPPASPPHKNSKHSRWRHLLDRHLEIPQLHHNSRISGLPTPSRSTTPEVTEESTFMSTFFPERGSGCFWKFSSIRCDNTKSIFVFESVNKECSVFLSSPIKYFLVPTR
jgi:hypothetical protein